MNDNTAPVACSDGILVAGAPSLIADGWEQRTVTDPTRIGDLEELYRELGFETRVVGMDPTSFSDACNSCAITACTTYLALFTRRPENALSPVSIRSSSS